MPTSVLIVIIVISSLVLIGLCVLLYFTIIKRGMLKKQSKEVIGIFEREHAVLFGDIQRYITRLKAISDLNLTYVDTYTKWQVKFKDVRDSNDANAQSMANSLKDALDARHWGEIKDFLPKAKKEIEDYASKVEELKTNLDNVFKIEEEVMSLAFKEKEKCRNVKQKYYAKKDDLRLVDESMTSLFKIIDEQITKADDAKDKACYEDAKELYVNNVDKTLGLIDTLLISLPKTCLELTSLLPDRTLSLRNRYQNMISEGYPLLHILTLKDIDAMDEEIEKMSQSVKVLNNTGISQRIKTLRERIDSYNEEFDKEEEARKIFETSYDSIYREENKVRQNFVNLSNSLDKIKSYYLLGAEDISKFQEISQSINRVSSSKTLLDNYVHSNSPQLYTVLVSKMNDLKDMVNQAKEELNSFETYLYSLKNDAENSSTLIKEYFKKTRDYESLLQSLQVEALNKRYAERFQGIYTIIDELFEILKKMPINVKKVQSEVNDLKTKGESLYHEIDEVSENLHNAENAIVHANRYRLNDIATDQMVSQAETMFNNASYKEAYQVTKDIAPAKNAN